MSKKSVHARAAKRNARAKVKRVSAARQKATSSYQEKKEEDLFDRLGKRPDFDTVLEAAVKEAQRGGHKKEDAKTPAELIEGLKKMTGEVFKMYCYITLAHEMIEQKVIEHALKCDLKSITLDMLTIDNRIGKLMFQIQSDKAEEAKDIDQLEFSTEVLDIGTILHSYSDILYEEIAALEPHTLLIEETVERLAKEVQLDISLDHKRAHAIQQIAYRYMAVVKLAYDESQAIDPKINWEEVDEEKESIVNTVDETQAEEVDPDNNAPAAV